MSGTVDPSPSRSQFSARVSSTQRSSVSSIPPLPVLPVPAPPAQLRTPPTGPSLTTSHTLLAPAISVTSTRNFTSSSRGRSLSVIHVEQDARAGTLREPTGVSAEQHALQETLRALSPEGETSDNDIYWLPVAVTRLGVKTPNVRPTGLNIHLGADRSGDKVDSVKGLMSMWHHTAKTEEKLFELQQQALRQEKYADFGEAEEGKSGDGKTSIGDPDESDEDLLELLDDMKINGYNMNFKRVNERRSKRYTSVLEEEIAERNEHLRERMEQMNSRVKKFEKGFEALDSLAVKMDTLAESSKLRVQFLEQCLVPLYNESARHQVCRRNAERALEAIDAALHHYQVPDKFTQVIQAGPVKNLPAYCAALEKVKASVEFFSEFHMATPEFEQVTALHRIGRENLIKEFRDLLRMHSKPVPAVMIQDAIINYLRDPSVSHEFAHFAETVYNDLKLVTAWFLKTKDKFDFMEVYANFRSATMRESLDQFRTFYKDVLVAAENGTSLDADARSVNMSVGRGADGASIHSGDGLSLAGLDEDTRSLSMNPDEPHGTPGQMGKVGTLKRRAPKVTPRKKAQAGAHGTVTANLFQKLRKLKTSSSAKKPAGVRAGIDDETYQRVEIYMAMISAFLKLVESEVGLMYGIIPDEHMREVFDRIILPAIERFGHLGKEMAEKIMYHVHNGDFSAILLLLQILEHFEDLKLLFDAALEGCTHETQLQWSRVQSIFRSAVAKTMDGFLGSIKSSTDRVLPADGTIHEVTSNTIAFLSNLVDYRPLFDSIITEETGKPEKRNLLTQVSLRAAPTTQGTHNFPQYFSSVVTHLLANLTTRSENYNDQTLKAVFLLNNISYMFNYLKQAGIIDVMKEENANVDRLIGARVTDQKTAYMECWTILSRLLTEAIGDAGLLRTRSPNDLTMKHTTADLNIQLKEKERQAIKDRCSAINKELQHQASKQEKYSVPDPTLRRSLQHQNRDSILSLYNTYRERYIHIPFTKFHDKYLPFTSQQVSDMLDRFFCQDTFSAAINGPGQTYRIDE